MALFSWKADFVIIYQTEGPVPIVETVAPAGDTPLRSIWGGPCPCYPLAGGIPLPNTSQCLSPAPGPFQEGAPGHPEQRLRGEVHSCMLTLGSSRAGPPGVPDTGLGGDQAEAAQGAPAGHAAAGQLDSTSGGAEGSEMPH